MDHKITVRRCGRILQKWAAVSTLAALEGMLQVICVIRALNNWETDAGIRDMKPAAKVYGHEYITRKVKGVTQTNAITTDDCDAFL